MTRRLLGQKMVMSAFVFAVGSANLTRTSFAQASPSPKPAPIPAAPAPAAPPPPQNGTSAVVMDLSAIESVIGKSVKSSTGEDLGRIVDLLVTTSGQVRGAVIDFGGVLGVGSRKVAVDWKALDFANFTKDGTVRLALTRNQVRVSPEYKSGDPVVILQASKPEVSAPPPIAKTVAAPVPAPSPSASADPPQGVPAKK